jgi:hypothetical protein
VPLRLKAKVKGNRRYVCDRKSRVAELNDAVFVEASDFMSFLEEEALIAGSPDVTVGVIVSGILQALTESGVLLEDVSAPEVVSLETETPKKTVSSTSRSPGRPPIAPRCAGPDRIDRLPTRRDFRPPLQNF